MCCCASSPVFPGVHYRVRLAVHAPGRTQALQAKSVCCELGAGDALGLHCSCRDPVLCAFQGFWLRGRARERAEEVTGKQHARGVHVTAHLHAVPSPIFAHGLSDSARFPRALPSVCCVCVVCCVRVCLGASRFICVVVASQSTPTQKLLHACSVGAMHARPLGGMVYGGAAAGRGRL